MTSKFRTDLKGRRKPFTKIDEGDDALFECGCTSACEDQAYFVGKRPFYEGREENANESVDYGKMKGVIERSLNLGISKRRR